MAQNLQSADGDLFSEAAKKSPDSATLVKIRLHTKTLVIHVCAADTIDTLRGIIDTQHQGCSSTYTLQTKFPPHTYDDISLTIEEAGISNSMLLAICQPT